MKIANYFNSFYFSGLISGIFISIFHIYCINFYDIFAIFIIIIYIIQYITLRQYFRNGE